MISKKRISYVMIALLCANYKLNEKVVNITTISVQLQLIITVNHWNLVNYITIQFTGILIARAEAITRSHYTRIVK